MIYLVSNNHLIQSKIANKATIKDVKDWCSTNYIRGVDTETIGNCWDGYIFTFQIGNSDTQFVIDCTTVNLLELKEELEDSRALHILQNSKYDDKFLFKKGIKICNIYDTFLAECILTTGLETRRLRLDYIVSKYCGEKYVIDKNVRGVINWAGLTDDVIKYAAYDVIALEEVMTKQKAEILKLDLVSVADLEFKCSRIFAEMEFIGMKIDTDKWLLQAEKREKSAYKYEKDLNDYIIELSKVNSNFIKYVQCQLNLFDSELKININWSSSTQVLKILKDIGLNIESVNEKIIEKYSNKYPIVNLYLNYKKNQTAISKFGKEYLKWIVPSTGAIHTSYWQILSTGRVSSGMKDEAPNMQQLPALNEVRNCFISREGYSFVDCDYSAMELVIAGCVSKENSWIEAFNNGYDLHSVVAETVYKDSWKNATEENCDYLKHKQKCNCKEHKEMRNKIKTLNYLSLYGGGPQKLSDSINIPLTEAKEIIKTYFKGLPKLSSFLQMLKDYGKKNLMIRTKPPYRRIRFFENPFNSPIVYSEIERQSGNTYIQGTGANITKLSMIKMDEERIKHNIDVKFVLQLHDAIVCEVKDEQAEEWFKIQKQCMIDAFKEVIDYPIDVDGYIEKFWKK
jgi:DNA polymerase-1